MLPAEVWGMGTTDFSLRRVECAITEEAADEAVAQQLAKLPVALAVQPLRLGKGALLQLSAGDRLPDSSVTVVDGTKQRISWAKVNGAKQHLTVRQQLVYLGRAHSSVEGGLEESAALEGEGQGAGRRKKRQQGRGRKRKKDQEEGDQGDAQQGREGEEEGNGAAADIAVAPVLEAAATGTLWNDMGNVWDGKWR